MANNTGLVYQHEEARPNLSPEIPLSRHSKAINDGKDVPEQAPSFQIDLTEVGISGKTVWILLPQGKFPFSAEIFVNLPRHVRGIHMSRIEEVVSQLYDKDFSDISHYARDLATLVIERQRGTCARVLVSGKFPLKRKTSVSQRISVDAVDISAEVCSSGTGNDMSFKTMMGLSLCHITACPCTQVYNQTLFPSVNSFLPPLTHSQRAMTKLCLEVHGGHPTYEEILECLEATLHVTQGLLKRPDEAEIVLKAHRFPQFAEDAVRETARQVGKRFSKKLPASTEVIIESLSLESIHNHNVHCALKSDLGEILNVTSL
jgi:GTP cyclohydrolase I